MSEELGIIEQLILKKSEHISNHVKTASSLNPWTTFFATVTVGTDYIFEAIEVLKLAKIYKIDLANGTIQRRETW